MNEDMSELLEALEKMHEEQMDMYKAFHKELREVKVRMHEMVEKL